MVFFAKTKQKKRNETKEEKTDPKKRAIGWNDGHDTNDTTEDVNVMNNRKTEPQRKLLHTLTHSGG